MQVLENDLMLEDDAILHGLDNESFQAYAEQIGTDLKQFLQQDKPMAIVIDQISYEDASECKRLGQNILT
jgi:putative ABC transport system permease protein